MLRVGRHRGVDQQALVGMVEIPVVVQVLVEPLDLAGVGVQGEGGVVVEVRVVDAADHELRGRRRDRRADVDEVQLGVVARDHPRADVLAFLERNTSPGLVAELARGGDEAAPPQLRAGRGVVRDDDAGVRTSLRRAAPAGDHLAVGDDRAGGLVGRVDGVVEHHRLPRHLAGPRVDGDHPGVRRAVEQVAAVDGDVAVGVDQAADRVVGHVVGPLAAVLPDQVAAHRVERLDDVARVRHVEDAVVDERRSLLQAGTERTRPDQPQARDVVPVDLVEGAEAPTVQRPPPHQPVPGRRVLEHRVGNRHELGRRLRDQDHRSGSRQQDGRERRRPQRISVSVHLHSPPSAPKRLAGSASRPSPPRQELAPRHFASLRSAAQAPSRRASSSGPTSGCCPLRRSRAA